MTRWISSGPNLSFINNHASARINPIVGREGSRQGIPTYMAKRIFNYSGIGTNGQSKEDKS